MAEEERGGDEAAPEAAQAQAKPARKSDTLIVIITGVLVIVLTPLISYMVIKKAAPESDVVEEKVVKVSSETLTLDLKPVHVNIAQTQGTRFLRLEMTLVLSEPRLKEQLSGNIALVTDRVILATSRRTLDELEGPKGREALKRDIMSEINAAIKGMMAGAVVDVYFKEFLIQ